MDNLRLYTISDKYIDFLKKVDTRVQNNKNRSRPYVGVVLVVDNYQYFVPMESPKPNHIKIKAGKHIMKIDDGRLGLLGFNNMIPVPTSEISIISIDSLSDKNYADLLKRQIGFLNEKKKAVYDHANGTYNLVINKKSKFLTSISCDFLSLERACKNYTPEHITKHKDSFERDR